MENEQQYQIFIGYNDAQTKDQYVTEEELVTLVSAFFAKFGVGFSLTHCRGGYLFDSGEYVIESTMVITIIGEQNLDIIKLARGLSMYMNQERLLITKSKVVTRYN